MFPPSIQPAVRSNSKQKYNEILIGSMLLAGGNGRQLNVDYDATGWGFAVVQRWEIGNMGPSTNICQAVDAGKLFDYSPGSGINQWLQ